MADVWIRDYDAAGERHVLHINWFTNLRTVTSTTAGYVRVVRSWGRRSRVVPALRRRRDEYPMEGLSAALADSYRIERELGAGGMATVWPTISNTSASPSIEGIT